MKYLLHQTNHVSCLHKQSWALFPLICSKNNDTAHSSLTSMITQAYPWLCRQLKHSNSLENPKKSIRTITNSTYLAQAISYTCTQACGSGSQCRPNECIFGSGKPRGVGILGRGVYEPGEGNGEVSSRATRVRGGQILSQQGGFQVSRGGLKRGAKGN
jgi:hypothetical protein